jgi:hypothetical protein
MEVCDGDLEQYISGIDSCSYLSSYNPRLFDDIGLGERGIWNTWDIMEQIAKGVEYIHNMGRLHYNLKPRNGNVLFG